MARQGGQLVVNAIKDELLKSEQPREQLQWSSIAAQMISDERARKENSYRTVWNNIAAHKPQSMGAVVLFKEIWNLFGKNVIKGIHNWVSPIPEGDEWDRQRAIREMKYETVMDHINPSGGFSSSTMPTKVAEKPNKISNVVDFAAAAPKESLTDYLKVSAAGI